MVELLAALAFAVSALTLGIVLGKHLGAANKARPQAPAFTPASAVHAEEVPPPKWVKDAKTGAVTLDLKPGHEKKIARDGYIVDADGVSWELM